MHKGSPTQFSVNSQIIVNAPLFQKFNPNYSRPNVTEPEDTDNAYDLSFQTSCVEIETELANLVQSYNKALADIKEEDFLICCLTVLGFSFMDKTQGKILPFALCQQLR